MMSKSECFYVQVTVVNQVYLGQRVREVSVVTRATQESLDGMATRALRADRVKREQRDLLERLVIR